MRRTPSGDTADSDGGSSNIKVYVRARPPEDSSISTDFIDVNHEEKSTMILRDPAEIQSNTVKKNSEYNFDRVFWTDAAQEEIFNRVCKPQVLLHCIWLKIVDN